MRFGKEKVKFREICTQNTEKEGKTPNKLIKTQLKMYWEVPRTN